MSFIKKYKLNNRGQSLLETVFALGILIVALAGTLALTASSVVGQKESESQIIANNLAREGVEVIRNIRDSNWLANTNWDLGFSQGDSAIVDFNRATNNWFVNFDFIDASLYVAYDGLYSHDSNGRTTPFSRQLNFEYICLDDEDGYESIKYPCSSQERKVGVKVTAKVSWQERGRSRDIILEDLLYDWK